ncbi:MAG: heavy metal-binding domain-containing protein [Bdellovibrionales bacterium]|nr:heavy metal-binding domain-containing protein [Bdellovibrionales bacterium]
MFEIGTLLFFLVIGYGVGTYTERKHYQAIEERERNSIHLPTVTFGKRHVGDDRIHETQCVSGSVVISIDYFKRFVAGLQNIFGGTVTAYETLVDRARREAVLRMKESANGATTIVNTRIETATIGQSAGKKSAITCVEAFAYGTAIWENEKTGRS